MKKAHFLTIPFAALACLPLVAATVAEEPEYVTVALLFNRTAIEEHLLFPYIELIEGSSIDQDVVSQVGTFVSAEDTVLVILDSCHTKAHVLSEIEAYSQYVSKDSYIVATDGIMGQVQGRVRTEEDWDWNNPEQAALEFVEKNSDFEIVEPAFPFNEGEITKRVTYWPSCYIKCVK